MDSFLAYGRTRCQDSRPILSCEMERRNRKVKIASIGIKKIDSDQFGICLVSSHQMRAKSYIISTAPGKTEIARLSIPRCAIPSSRAPP